MTNFVDDLASFALDLDLADVPAEVRDRARLILLDSCGAIIGARSLPEIKALADWTTGDGSAPLAAFTAGTAGVSLELDEGCAESRGHPGMHVIPAALIVAGRGRATGAALLTAVIAGYEVAARLGAATKFRDRIHPHGTWGGCGGAVAAARLLGLDHQRLAHAIRIAAALSVATHYQTVREGATVRNLWSGMGNLVAVAAAESARAGFTGPLDGPAWVYGDTLGVSFDREVAAGGLGSDWYMTRNYFKLYACCRHAHASVDAFRSIVDGAGVSAADIAGIEAYTYARAADAVGQPQFPVTPLAAKFSLAYMFSAYLETGSLGREAFEPPLLTDGALRDVAGKVSVAEDPAYTAMLPATRAARVTVRFTDGREETAEAMGSRGDPHDPLSPEEVRDKFLSLAVPELGPEAAAGVVETVFSIESIDDAAALVAALK